MESTKQNHKINDSTDKIGLTLHIKKKSVTQIINRYYTIRERQQTRLPK